MARVGILTGGGDCPGLNAVIRAIVRRGLDDPQTSCVGFRHGWAGVMKGNSFELTRAVTAGILGRGGTILGTSRTNPFANGADGSEEIRATLAAQGVDALIAIGGDDTLGVAARLVDAGIPVGVSVAPLIPFITEPDLERVMEACAQAGATSASYIVLRLPWEVAPLFKAWLAAHYPERAERVMNRVREMRGGADYDASFAHRMKGEGLWADLLRQRFNHAARRLGLTGRNHGILDVSEFYRPVAAASAGAQLDLF